MNAAGTNPNFVADAITRGTITDINGDDIPLIDADTTLIDVTSDQILYESTRRQRVHIEEKTPTTRKLTVSLQLVRDEGGRLRLALPEEVPAWLSGKQVTFYYEDDSTKEGIAA